MKIATIDSIYEAVYENKSVVVKDQNGQTIGDRAYTLNYAPRCGFDILDQRNMENIAIEIVDIFKAKGE